MKQNYAVTLMAAASLVIFTPELLHAQSASSPQDANGSQAMSQDQNSSVSADQMVPTRAALITTVDAKDTQPGQEFKAKLPRKVHLKNGQELPGGTMLIGKIGQDDMNQQGRSKLVLCINEAQLKDGKTVPVKATIVGVYRPGMQQSSNYPMAAGDQVPNSWNSGILKVDELDALHHVDLHSNIDSKNSGVLVSKDDNDIKLKSGTELALAIAADTNQQGENNGSGGSR